MASRRRASQPVTPASPEAKNMCAMPAARSASTGRVPLTASIFSKADLSASALRVNCTAEASASNSRCRQIAACSARPMNRPT